MNTQIPPLVLRKAHNIAFYSTPINNQRVSAVVYNKTGIVEWGVAQRKTHPMMLEYGHHWYYLHAEIHALAMCVRTGVIHSHNVNLRIFHDMTMYVHRIRGDGKIALAKPCKGCMKALIEFGFTDIKWSNYDG